MNCNMASQYAPFFDCSPIHSSSPIRAAVHLALYGTLASSLPALSAAVAGIAHGRVAEPITRCQHGQEIALCVGQHHVNDEEVDRHEIVLPRERTASNPPPHPAQTAWVWERAIEREAHQAAQANLRHQHDFIAPFAP
jgi:hypothetical protein